MTPDEKVNILVVDDLPEKLLVVETVLEELEENVVKVLSGRDALRCLLDREFAVILLDVNMPDMDGFETAAMIRARKQTAHTPIIFITAFADEMHTSRGYSLGAVDYILSPVVPEILRTKVSVFVDLFRKTQQIRHQAEERVALEREQAARAAAEAATRRSAFLAEAGTALLRSLDLDETVRELACLPVPFLADACAVTQVDESGTPRTSETARRDFEKGDCIRRTDSGLPPWPVLTSPIAEVLRSGRSVLLPELVSSYESDGIEAHSALIVPLRARGRTLGTIALAVGPSGRRYGEEDLALAEDLGVRAAVAMDNARLYKDIQEQDRRKNEFLAMLAHELRNPLAPIRNAVQILRSPSAEGEEGKWARDVIGRQVEQMVRLVDDLLDISRITGGKIQLQRTRVDAEAIVARAVETSRPWVETRRHTLSVTLPREAIALNADATRLAQVLANLLNNAAKYTPEGGRIALEVAREAGEVVFRVIDTGVGIPREMLARVFDLFMQVDQSLDRSQGGLGIGLTLVRQLVELHGGRVEASSPGPNQGSEFVVRVPALAPAPKRTDPALPVNGPRGRDVNGPARRVLVVDDNQDAAKSLSKLLRLCGHEVAAAHDGPAALDSLKTFPAEVVLLDIGLPGMSGYDVACAIRQQPDLEDVVLVALTGYGQADDRRRSAESGIAHHLVKPVDLDHLVGLLAALPQPLTAEACGRGR
jgi:signal transduction histidine kinase/response regulator RpfG family c-di-GMP phosphodiesterase